MNVGPSVAFCQHRVQFVLISMVGMSCDIHSAAGGMQSKDDQDMDG